MLPQKTFQNLGFLKLLDKTNYYRILTIVPLLDQKFKTYFVIAIKGIHITNTIEHHLFVFTYKDNQT